MAWKCPQCSSENDPAKKKCACGYSFYEILGVKEDAPAAEIEQTYQYLLKVWKTSGGAQDASSQSRRLKKIDDAYAVFRQISGTDKTAAEGRNVMLYVTIGAVGFVLFVVLAFYAFAPKKDQPQPAGAPSSPQKQSAPEGTVQAPSGQPASGESKSQQPAQEKRSDSPDLNAEKSPAWAIESVKKSHVLDRAVSVDALMNKWTQENSDKLRFIGWIAKKADDNAFLVSYTATDGVTPKGFYFEINAETGEIRNIANYPELQQKYGIKGN